MRGKKPMIEEGRVRFPIENQLSNIQEVLSVSEQLEHYRQEFSGCKCLLETMAGYTPEKALREKNHKGDREKFTSFMMFLLDGLQQGYFRNVIEDLLIIFKAEDEYILKMIQKQDYISD